jgi:hypothetical protein
MEDLIKGLDERKAKQRREKPSPFGSGHMATGIEISAFNERARNKSSKAVAVSELSKLRELLTKKVDKTKDDSIQS